VKEAGDYYHVRGKTQYVVMESKITEFMNLKVRITGKKFTDPKKSGK